MSQKFFRYFDPVLVWLVFLLGLWFVVIGPLGPALSRIPGDLSDSRFNNYVLEHFFRWLTGLDKDYWNPAFLYPLPQVLAFSDNLLGSAFIYAFFRWLGLDTLTAFQGWYIVGFCLNYLACVFVLARLRFGALARSAGAFFFTFGLPVLAQEFHVQLLYRFGVPLACYFLWSFYRQPRLRKLAFLLFWLVWQYYLTIYVGLLLTFLLLVLAVLLPFSLPAASLAGRLLAWPLRLALAWRRAGWPERGLVALAVTAIGTGLAALLGPYVGAEKLYGFARGWTEISSMLPRPLSYLTQDEATLWSSTAGGLIHSIFSDPTLLPNRHEHQLFPGIFAVVLLVAGLALRHPAGHNRLARLQLWTAAILFVLTLYAGGFSLFAYISDLPGINSLRAVGRVVLVMMWPVSIVIAWAVDGLRERSAGRGALLLGVYALVGLLVLESGLYNHQTFSKADAQARLVALRAQLPAAVPSQPILFVVENGLEPPSYSELDAMLLAQQLGWPTVNGYTGNYPLAYRPARGCSRLSHELISFMTYSEIPAESPYLFDTLERVVTIGYGRCGVTAYSPPVQPGK